MQQKHWSFILVQVFRLFHIASVRPADAIGGHILPAHVETIYATVGGNLCAQSTNCDRSYLGTLDLTGVNTAPVRGSISSSSTVEFCRHLVVHDADLLRWCIRVNFATETCRQHVEARCTFSSLPAGLLNPVGHGWPCKHSPTAIRSAGWTAAHHACTSPGSCQGSYPQQANLGQLFDLMQLPA